MAADEFHGEEPAVVFNAEFVQGGEVGVGDVGERAEFLFEAIDPVGVGFVEELEGNVGVAFAVENTIDNTKGSAAEFLAHGEAFAASEG